MSDYTYKVTRKYLVTKTYEVNCEQPIPYNEISNACSDYDDGQDDGFSFIDEPSDEFVEFGVNLEKEEWDDMEIDGEIQKIEEIKKDG
tara:strand:- start:1026 stop:1289 length:264 start_codon:yes stop_codon:yes gene_type:complete